MSSRPPRPFDPAVFAELVRARGLGYGAVLHYASSTGSTNDLALESARTGGASGSVFFADHQAQGRGRRGKTWLAAPCHNLLFSVLVRPPEGSTPPAALTLAVGLGVRAALGAVSATSLGVKWPNDVLAGPRKLAGILCEGVFEGKRLSAIVIGIGINVLSQPLPAELAGQVVALDELAPGAELERERLLCDVLHAVEGRVERMSGAGFVSLLPEFAEYDALAGERVEVSGPTPLVGRARGIDALGPFPADSLFVKARDGAYDLTLALYHDQGLMAAKLLGFGRLVTLLVGLPLVRTSVGHGTAFDIAGKNLADHRNLLEAIRIAAEVAVARRGAARPGVAAAHGRAA